MLTVLRKRVAPALLLEHPESPLTETILGAELAGWEKPSQLPADSQRGRGERHQVMLTVLKERCRAVP